MTVDATLHTSASVSFLPGRRHRALAWWKRHRAVHADVIGELEFDRVHSTNGWSTARAAA